MEDPNIKYFQGGLWMEEIQGIKVGDVFPSCGTSKIPICHY
jgi:hypothetical protein